MIGALLEVGGGVCNSAGRFSGPGASAEGRVPGRGAGPTFTVCPRGECMAASSSTGWDPTVAGEAPKPGHRIASEDRSVLEDMGRLGCGVFCSTPACSHSTSANESEVLPARLSGRWRPCMSRGRSMAPTGSSETWHAPRADANRNHSCVREPHSHSNDHNLFQQYCNRVLTSRAIPPQISAGITSWVLF